MNWSRVFNCVILLCAVSNIVFDSFSWWTGAPATGHVWLFAVMFSVHVSFLCVRDLIRGVWA